MHRRVHHFHRISLTAALGGLAILAACTSGDDPTPDVATATPAAESPLAQARSELAEREPWPAGQPVQQSQWAIDRLAVVKALYGFTEVGESWINGYDFRQMVEQPAWFGSFGYRSWAGAGEAVPRSVLHEISHSYWGAFSVAGQPELSWQEPGDVPEALASYRQDLATFMQQPPDRFEPLRDRFRNFPRLDIGQYPDLHHSGEADLLYMTGGNLGLIPPLIQPYYSGYLAEDGISAENGESISSWDVALAWFNGLSHEDRAIAGDVFGLQHFPRGPYVDLPGTGLSGVDEQVRTLYEHEERQRLTDFVDQVDGIIEREFSLADATGADRGFDFWKGYLSDKLRLHGKHPEVLTQTGSLRGQELANALDFYSSISGSDPAQQADRFRESQNQPMVAELAVLLKPRAIVELFEESGDSSGIAAVLGSRANRLSSLVAVVDRIADEQAGTGSSAAALVLEDFILSTPEDQFRADAFLLLDLLRSAGDGLAADVLRNTSDSLLVYVLEVQPAFARQSEIGPDRLLAAVGIGPDATLDEVAAGAGVLAANSSGNFAIDAAYDSAVFEQLDRFAESDPAGVLSVLAESGMRLVPWITRDGDGSLNALRSAQPEAAELLAGLTGNRETPWRIIHLIARADPELAASLTMELSVLEGAIGGIDGPIAVLSRAIREFGFDIYWSERNAGPNVVPERFAEYLLALDAETGQRELEQAIADLRDLIASDIAGEKVDSSARMEFERTMSAAIESKSGEDADRLTELLETFNRDE